MVAAGTFPDTLSAVAPEPGQPVTPTCTLHTSLTTHHVLHNNMARLPLEQLQLSKALDS